MTQRATPSNHLQAPTTRQRPTAPVGLYDPAFEHDSCGVAFVARLNGVPSHETIVRAITALDNLEHRGAAGADPLTGDGAGILLQIPDEFFRGVLDVELPPAGAYGVAVCFLPRHDEAARLRFEQLLVEAVAAEGQRVLCWRDVPLDLAHVGASAREVAPAVRQLFVAASPELAADRDAFERKLYVIRRLAEQQAGPDLVIPSFSAKTVVYKGMLMAPQLAGCYPDLQDERLASALVLIHSRFSTNTFPSWELAHPYRLIAHNGEINTVRGNVNWMRARESQLASPLFGDDLKKVLPVVRPGGSDTANFDNVLELLVLAGRSVPHAMMMMIPEAYVGRDDLPDHLKGFYAFHSCLTEPWDGQASICFTDGTVIGATLDRNGLRPGRWLETKDGWVVLASETGVLDEPAENILRKGRLQPGNIFLVDLEQGRIVDDAEVKEKIATRKPYGEWYEQGVVHLHDLPERPPRVPRIEPLRSRQQAFGYTQEDLKVILTPLARNAEEAIGSMGNDVALAVLSDQRPLLYSYFKQLFAQVTNPPIDSTREAVVMSVATSVGSERNLLGESLEHAHQLQIEQPILRSSELEKLRQVDSDIFRAHTIDTTWPVAEGPGGMDAALARICGEADEALAGGVNILILSDRNLGAERAPIPALLAVAAVHHHLVREGTRLQAGLVIESGEPREVHHFATLIGYGAAAINPYVMLETLGELVEGGWLPTDMTAEQAKKRAIKGISKGLLKTISKMGISTISSYCGAQIFEAVGLEPTLVARHFTGTPSRIAGIGTDVLAREALDRHSRAYPADSGELLPLGGVYAWRRDGEHHQWNPETIALLQHSVRSGGYASYEEFSKLVNDDATRKATLRGLLQFRTASTPIPLDDVEPASEIVRRFSTGAMSLGSLGREVHETLAIAMNRLGGKSNTGEGGEDPVRYVRDANGDSRRSAIKQVASGRFGVNIHYLSNADQLQIKMAQGAKPGEGGQLPGHKVDAYIAKIRFTTPGVGLISPPPHHDIYSIEDLKQLIYDLRCANPTAQVSVKLVSEMGVGTVAAGVAKCNADHVVISGHDGGTGASPLSSVQFAGIPWEIGLAETQQTLVMNDLRSRIWVQTDGQLKTGRDVVIAALLGADEMGFATAPLVATGCVMMRACHLNTCPVGIATQDPELRKRFKGTPEHVVNFFFFVAEEARRIMAQLGIARFEDLIGRVDLLEANTAIEHWKARGIDLSNLLLQPDVPEGTPLRRTHGQDSPLPGALDWELIELARAAIEDGTPVTGDVPVRNVNRAVGGLLSHHVTKRWEAAGLPEGTIRFGLRGSAGQSFGAWLAPGIELTLDGDANDYAGKGLSGGTIAIRPPAEATFEAERNVIVGNTVLYGATRGKAFFRGLAGERFAVRNSGADAVVEGVGDHGCEYMTGGHVVVLGPTGRNFAAGMSGGIAYVLDEDGRFPGRCNTELVDLDPFGEADVSILRGLVEEHLERTGSTVAARVLTGWGDVLPSFVKVMPRDYKAALAALASGNGSISYPDEHPVSSGGEGFVTAEIESGDGRLMGELGAFLKLGRVETPERDPKERVRDYHEFVRTLAGSELAGQGARCMECGVPFCHNGCPVNNLIPDWNDLVYRDRWEEAIAQLHRTNNFPDFTGRLCPAPCEAACVLEIREGEAVSIKQIELAIINRAWEEGWVKPQPAAVRTGRTVAVIGSGPSGLACAQQLARAGHSVTVYERDEAGGGLVRFGVPDFKIEKHVVQRRVDQLAAEGVEFRFGVDVGVDVTIDDLRAGHEAVVVATGSRVPRDLPVPGRELDGVHYAMEYLYGRNRWVAREQGPAVPGAPAAPATPISAAGKHVIVIGGGDTGADCVANSIREGAASVTQIELIGEPPQSRPDDISPWPRWPLKLRVPYALKEGGTRDFAISTTELLGSNGRVEQIRWVENSGRPPFEPIAGTEETRPADLVLLAMGFVGPEPLLLDALGVDRDERGNAKAPSYCTSADGVFAAGDARRGQSLIVWAINEGRQCARAVERWLAANPI